jgi:hypothetical protein
VRVELDVDKLLRVFDVLADARETVAERLDLRLGL